MNVRPAVGRPSKRVLTACLEAAIAAPSVLNTQPWRFQVHAAGIDVRIDADRRLAAVDPDGRELYISVGAALFNLRLALLDHGWQPILRRSTPGRPDVVATVGFGFRSAPNASVRAMAAAIPRRRTNRRPYADMVVPESVFDELREAAAAEGAILAVPHPVVRDAILSLVRTAERRLWSDERYRAELARWVHSGPGSGDGLPAKVLGPVDAASAAPMREFGGTPDDPGPVRFEARPKLLVLSTTGDGPRQWLGAGQALQRVLLTATVRGLATQPLTQPLEVSSSRGLIGDHARHLYPQMILRVGYGTAVPVAPRRPLQHVLDPFRRNDARPTLEG